MIHIGLTILKIIGIVLLVLLGILVSLILIVLFVPLRYRITVKKEEEPLSADVSVSWLLRLVRLHARYYEKKAEGRVQVLNFTLKSFSFPAGHKGGGKETGKAVKSGDDASAVLVVSGEAEAAGGSPDKGAARKAGAKAAADDSPDKGAARKAGAKAAADSSPDKGAARKAGAKAAAEDSPDKGAARKTETKAAAGGSPDKEAGGEAAKAAAGSDSYMETGRETAETVSETAGEKFGKLNSYMDRVREILMRLPDRALGAAEHAADLLLKMVNLPSDVYNRTDDTVARITKKLDAIDRKLKPFFSIEAEHVMGRMMSHLRYLWKGYRLRSIEGYVRFGTDRPDLTGRICGLIYLILPARADRYLVDPQFYETVFRTDTDIRGVIRLYRLLVVAVRLLLDKEFRILIRKIRHR